MSDITPEMIRVKQLLDRARSDAEIILSCLGPLSLFTIQADRMARDGASLVLRSPPGEAGPDVRDTGNNILVGWADALKEVRERMASLMDYFGDEFNATDTCCERIQDVSEPVFDLLHGTEAVPV